MALPHNKACGDEFLVSTSSLKSLRFSPVGYNRSFVAAFWLESPFHIPFHIPFHSTFHVLQCTFEARVHPCYPRVHEGGWATLASSQSYQTISGNYMAQVICAPWVIWDLYLRASLEPRPPSPRFYVAALEKNRGGRPGMVLPMMHVYTTATQLMES